MCTIMNVTVGSSTGQLVINIWDLDHTTASSPKLKKACIMGTR